MKTVYIPYEEGTNNYIKVTINGESTIIPKGKQVEVEDNVAEVLDNMQRSAKNKILIQQIYEGVENDVNKAAQAFKELKTKQKL
ncbi:MAG TPA: hypothetical protein PLD48_09795 [Bacillota bacterium]|nr:hypothetical protein [Bacillota bacterium]HOK69782.1 hypothetical protein [Bacillota bacterium]HPP86010.1 hypothetical protein [Bacillota bacterium]